jgi:GntR family transcriptional regulator
MEKAFLSKRDVYIEIAQRYEKYITLGVIKPGEKLPSVRTAATELRVNPNTVQRAYSLLEEKGLIRSMPKKGAFVIFGNENSRQGESFEALTAQLLHLKQQGTSKEEIISVIEEVYKHD